MTVIDFLYLFTFIEMLPPWDLRSAVLKSQGTEPAGPQPHHQLPAPTRESHPFPMRLRPCNDGNLFPGHKDSPSAFLGPPPSPGMGFLGSQWGSPTWTHVGRKQALSAVSAATGMLLGQGYGGISRSSCQQGGRYRLRQIRRGVF